MNTEMNSGHTQCPCMEQCPLNRAMQLIGGKWKVQILCSLSYNGSTRYNTLKKNLDKVSNNILSKALKELEQDGLITRTEYLEVPIRVEYDLTEKSRKLVPILESLSDWGEEA